MSKLMHRLWSEDAGQDIAEYAVMLAVILVLGGGNSSLDRIECQQCILQRRQFDPVEARSQQILSTSSRSALVTFMTRFTPGPRLPLTSGFQEQRLRSSLE